MSNALTKLALLSSLAHSVEWPSVPDRAIPCNFPRSQEEIKKKHKANKARKAAKKARKRNRRK